MTPRPALVTGVDEDLVRGRAAVLLLDRAPQHPVVAPAVAAVERVDRHQLDQRHAQLHQVVEPIDGREQRALGGERAHVQLVDDAARQLPTGPQLVGPAVRVRVEGARQPVHPVRSPPGPRVGQHDVAAVDQVAVVQRSVGRRFGQATDRTPEAAAVGSPSPRGASPPAGSTSTQLDLLGRRGPDGERVVLHREHSTRTGSATRVTPNACSHPGAHHAREARAGRRRWPRPGWSGPGCACRTGWPDRRRARHRSPSRTRRARSARPRWSSPARRAAGSAARRPAGPRPRPGPGSGW